jgi:hypothetical protein
MKWDKIKNFVFGGGAAVVFALVLGWLDWRAEVHATEAYKSDAGQLAINAMIDTKIAAMNIGSDQKIIDMDSDRATNTHDIETNTENIVINRDDVRRAFQVLMGDNPDG